MQCIQGANCTSHVFWASKTIKLSKQKETYFIVLGIRDSHKTRLLSRENNAAERKICLVETGPYMNGHHQAYMKCVGLHNEHYFIIINIVIAFS